MALVSEVIARSSCAVSRQKVSGSISTKTAFAPAASAELAEATNEKAGTITSSPY